MVAADGHPHILPFDEQDDFRLSRRPPPHRFNVRLVRQPVERRAEDRRYFRRRRNPLALQLADVRARLFLITPGVAGDDNALRRKIDRDAAAFEYEFHPSHPKIASNLLPTFAASAASACFSNSGKSSRSSRRIWRSSKSPASKRTLARPLSSASRGRNARSRA